MIQILGMMLIPHKDKDPGKFSNLTISGSTREGAIDVYCVVNKDATINCSGTEALKMSDYKVEPPFFLFGAMKTGDAIKLDFNIVYANNNIK